MKTIPIALAAHYAQQATSIAVCLKVTRRDAAVYGFTSLDAPITVAGLQYLPGFSISSLSSSAVLSVDNLELTILPDDDLPAADLLAGLYNGAAFEIFEVNWQNVADGVNVLKRGTLGEVTVRRGMFVVEFRSLTQALQQSQGIVTTKTCRARLGDEKCRVDLTTFTESGTVTAVESQRIFTDSSRGEAAGWFAEGILTFDTGANAGYSQKVKVFASSEFTLSLPMPFAVAPGDTYTVIAGCQKRLEEDCKAKFDNVLNFQGEPHLPGLDKLSKSPKAVDQPATVPNLPPNDFLQPGEGGP